MKKTKKILAMACAMALSAAIAVGGTLAYLTSTDSVKNTFTVGNVAITLDETDVDLNGVKVSDTRVKENEYKLMPGHTYTKDPIIHVADDSEDCWLFIKLENGLEAIIDATTIENQLTANGNWTLIDEENNIYAYKAIVGAGDDVSTFANFKVKGAVTDLSSYEDAEIKVTAYAIQADGFTSAQVAWTNAGGEAQS